MNYTLRQLHAFLAVCELGSFTRAGKRLHVSQSAVSGLVGELEQTLRVRLLDRTTRRVEPTEAGRDLAERVGKALSDLDHAVRRARDVSDRLHGRLAVSAPPLLAAALLPSVVAAHRARYPGVAIALHDGTTEAAVAAVRAGEVDLCIGTLPPGLPDLEREALAADRLLLFCTRDHPLARARQVPWRALQGHGLVALSPGSALRQLVDASLRAAGVEPLPLFEAAQITTVLAMADAGLGVAVLPSVARVLRGYPRLTARPLVRPGVSRTIHAVHQAGRTLSPAGQSFVAMVKEQLGRMTALQSLGIEVGAE